QHCVLPNVAVKLAGVLGQPGRIRREGANHDGLCGVECVVLDDDAGPWFGPAGSSARDSPDLPALHSSPSSLMASINAWSSAAASLAATAAACRWASALK